MSRNLDAGLVAYIRTIARNEHFDDGERAQQLADEAIEFARVSMVPNWVAVREKETLIEWRWEIKSGTVARVWQLRSGSWIGQIESQDSANNYIKIFRSSQGGMVGLEGMHAWQNVNASDAEPS